MKKLFKRYIENFKKAGSPGKGLTAAQRLIIAETVFCGILAIALLRLAFMQCFPHSSYQKFYDDRYSIVSENDKDEMPMGWDSEEITDRDGTLLAIDDFRTDVIISTTNAPILSYSEMQSCADTDEKDNVFTTIPLFKTQYRSSCSYVRGKKQQKKLAFVEKLMEENPSIFSENRKNYKKIDNTSVFKNLDMGEYMSLQIKFEKIKKIRDNINGFKFDFPKGTLQNICIAENGSPDLKTIKTGDIKIPSAEIKRMSAEERQIYDEYEDKPLSDYCDAVKPEEKVIVGLILSDIYEKNLFTPELLDEFYNSLSDEEKNEVNISTSDKKAVLTIDQKIFNEKNYKKKYCSTSRGYDSVFCRKLYEYNLSLIEDFFYSNEGYLKSHAEKFNYNDIKAKLEKAKKTYPNGREEIRADINDTLRGFVTSVDWWNKDFVDYVLFKIRNFSSVKQGTEFSRKVSIKNKNDVAFVVINKKMARYFYSIFNDKKMMYGTAKAKAQDDMYRDYAISLNEVLKKNGVSRLLDENEKDYVELVTIPTNSFYALLPQIAMFGKTFFTDGIEFETDRHYRSIVAGTPVYQTAKSIKEADKVRQKNPLGTRARLLAYKEAQPLAKGEQPKDYVPSLTETRPEDYILAQIIGADSRSYGGIFNCYFPKNPSDMRRGEMDSRVSKVQLTIDSHLQNFVEMKLRERGKEIGAEKGIALVQDVNSGELLAAAAYNPEWLNGNPLDMLTFSYQPGSTFKPLSVAIALESGLVRETDLFDIQNEHKEHTDPYGCGKDAKKKSEWCKISDDHPMPAGKANMAEIIAASSNLGTSLIADRLWDKEINDPSKIAGTPWDSSEYKPLGQQYAEYMRSLFGIGSKTGLGQDLCVSESAGRNISLERKQNSNATYNYLDYLKDSYGQGPVEVTPVQLISAYSALVNGGTLYKPQIVKEIQYSNGQTDVIKPQKVMENIISQKTSDLVKGYMKSVFEENVGCKKDSNGKTSCSTELSKSVQGTGRGYRINGFDWGGKTGTADKMACPNGKICYTYQCSDIEDEHEKEICMAACPKNVGCNQSKCAKLYPVDKDKKNPANKEDRQICENMVSSYDFIRIFKNKKEGKTVRARKRPDGFTDVSPNRASFAGFLPYNDPKYAILVVFDESEWASEEESIHPQGAGAAGPVLQAIAKELIADMKKNDSLSETR